MPAPEVTVVIPTRDRWAVLASCGLRAALLQQHVDLEVVVVDDGSGDETPERLAEIEDSRVRGLRHDVSEGVASARNAGIEAARAPWIAFLDDDDLWSPRKLRAQLDAVRSSDVAFVVTGVVVLDGNRSVAHVTRPAPITAGDLLERNTVPAGSSNVLAPTDLVRAVGGFDEGLTYVADWDLWIRLALRGPVAVCAEPLVAYVRHGSGTTFSGRAAVDEMRYFLAKHDRTGVTADPAGFLSWVALQDRRAGKRRSAAGTLLRSGLAYRKPRHLVHAAAALVGLHRTRPSPTSSHARPDGLPSEPPADAEWLALYR